MTLILFDFSTPFGSTPGPTSEPPVGGADSGQGRKTHGRPRYGLTAAWLAARPKLHPNAKRRALALADDKIAENAASCWPSSCPSSPSSWCLESTPGVVD